MILDIDKNKLKENIEKGTHPYYNALQEWQPASKKHCISVEQLTVVGWAGIRWYATMTNAQDYIFYQGLLGNDKNKYRIINKTEDFK